jgi:hypothetical protein
MVNSFKNQYQFILVVFVVLHLSTAVFANSCPDFTGSFNCIDPDSKEAFSMEISQSTADDITTYTYVYDGGASSFVQKVSDKGEINFWDSNKPEFYIARCGGDRVNYFGGKAERLFVHDRIDPSDRSYVETIVKEDGTEKEYIRCSRKETFAN